MLQTLLEAEVTLPDGFLSLLERSLIGAGFTEMVSVPSPSMAIIGHRPTPNGGCRTGYSIFYSQRNLELKAEKVEMGRQARIIKEWKALPEDKKEMWRAQTVPAVSSPTRPPAKLTTYQSFVRERMASIKKEEEGHVKTSGSDKMIRIGKEWNKLNQNSKFP